MNELEKSIAGCIRNDRKSQREIYYQFYPALFTLCKKFFQDDHAIQTALNNGMLRVFKNIELYKSERGSFFSWVYTIVRNECITKLRGEKIDSTLVYHDEWKDDQLQIPFEGGDWEAIFFHLDKLPPVTRAVCSLFYLEDFTVKEIEQELGVKGGTVKWHLNEGRSRLKGILKNAKSQAK